MPTDMDTVILGRTGLRVSIMGLGAGGYSRLGQATGSTRAESVRIVHRALDLGINLIDTAEAYGTEEIVGIALHGLPRYRVVISTNKARSVGNRLIRAAELRKGLDESLRRLKVDAVDIFHLHGVHPHEYTHVQAELIPALLDLRDQGKLRWIGITESWGNDLTHSMLTAAQQDDVWDVMMVGFNLLNQTARARAFPHTHARNIGVLCMFAVRRALTSHTAATELLTQLAAKRQIDLRGRHPSQALQFLTERGVASTLAEAAYRYCRYEPGIHVVLSGTGNLAHLEENVRSLHLPPLPAEVVAQVNDLFARVDSVTGN